MMGMRIFMNNRLAALSILIVVLVSGCSGGTSPTEGPVQSVPPTVTPQGERDYSTTRTSDAGLYIVSIVPDLDPVAINKIHSWTIHVEMADGTAVDDATITVGGGMPEHGHGLPTAPEVTENLGDGDYRVEGMKFQMPGWWEVKFNIDAEAGIDSVTFNLLLN
jgi:hypothetical protein